MADWRKFKINDILMSGDTSFHGLSLRKVRLCEITQEARDLHERDYSDPTSNPLLFSIEFVDGISDDDVDNIYALEGTFKDGWLKGCKKVGEWAHGPDIAIVDVNTILKGI